MTLPSTDHPSPALRAPSPLLGGGERDGVRGDRSSSRVKIAGLDGSWILAPDTLLTAAAAVIVVALSGCSSTSSAISTTGSVLTKTVTTTGKVATKTALVAGNVATTTATTAVKAGVSAASSVAKTAVVTFVDSATGVATQLPYAEGMKLYAASKTAEVDLALKSIQIMRGAQTIAADGRKVKQGTQDIALKAGDVIKLSSTGAK